MNNKLRYFIIPNRLLREIYRIIRNREDDII